MIYLTIRQQVADYAKWRKAFDGHASARRAAGSTEVIQVYRGVDEPNTVTATIEWNDAEKARQFGQSAKLKQVMKDAGVISTPDVTFLNRV